MCRICAAIFDAQPTKRRLAWLVVNRADRAWIFVVTSCAPRFIISHNRDMGEMERGSSYINGSRGRISCQEAWSLESGELGWLVAGLTAKL